MSSAISAPVSREMGHIQETSIAREQPARTHIQRHSTFYRSLSVLIGLVGCMTAFGIAGGVWPKLHASKYFQEFLIPTVTRIMESTAEVSSHLFRAISPISDLAGRFFSISTESHILRGASYMLGILPAATWTVLSLGASLPGLAGLISSLSLIGASYAVPVAPGFLLVGGSYALWNAAKEPRDEVRPTARYVGGLES